MNRIEVKNNSVEEHILNDNFSFKSTMTTNICHITIVFKKNTDLEILFEDNLESKLNVEYIIEKNVFVNIYEIRKSLKTKVQYKYDIGESSKLYLYRFNQADNMREVDIINLIGENATIEFNLQTMSTNPEKYDIFVYHDKKYTTSILNNVGISLKGSITFNVTSVVPSGMSGSYIKQNNQIITMNEEKCQINPNLLIDEYDVDASHSAHIGMFKEDEIFYLMSRGINESEAIELLSKGLILAGLKESYEENKIISYIDKYWR